MYELITLEEKVGVPPSKFGESLKGTILAVLRETYDGQLNKDLGLVVTVTSIDEIGEGEIMPGDGAAHYDTKFKALVFKPELHEIVEGKVIEIVEFGAFVTLGALDGLVHVSQITDDFLSYDEKGGRLIGKESKKSVINGDVLRARIVALSLKKSQSQKVGLTMRQPGLGKIEWVEDLKKRGKEKPKEKGKPRSKPRRGRKR